MTANYVLLTRYVTRASLHNILLRRIVSTQVQVLLGKGSGLKVRIGEVMR